MFQLTKQYTINKSNPYIENRETEIAYVLRKITYIGLFTIISLITSQIKTQLPIISGGLCIKYVYSVYVEESFLRKCFLFIMAKCRHKTTSIVNCNSTIYACERRTSLVILLKEVNGKEFFSKNDNNIDCFYDLWLLVNLALGISPTTSF